jgi:tetratricopeptide (TPR) repeat protein
MKKSAATFIILFISAFFLFSQDYIGKGRLVGFVFDEQNAPIEGVKVTLFSLRAQQGFDVETDKEGKWVALGIRGGKWNIDFVKAGFAPRGISVDVQEFSRNPEIRLNLKKAEGLIITEELKNGLNLGNQLFEEKKYEEAVKVFEDLIIKYPEAYILYKNIGNAYFAREIYDKAEEYYLKILEKDPKNSDAMLLIGNCYANRNDTEKALEWYSKIEFEKIGDPIVLYNIGTNFYRLSKFDDALKYYKRSVEVKPDFLDGLYQLGLAYLTLGNNTEAIVTFETYLKHDRDSEKAGQVKGFLEYLRKEIRNI